MSRLTPGASRSMSAMPKAPTRRATAARTWTVFEPERGDTLFEFVAGLE